MLTIEEGINPSEPRMSWPFKDMAAGQSVLITDPALEQKARLAAAAMGRSRKWIFSCRKEPKGLRIFRVA
jgi:hypothetical protein